jgi:outer membrane protein OmpA-like peptidoglycan-associated protein
MANRQAKARPWREVAARIGFHTFVIGGNTMRSLRLGATSAAALLAMASLADAQMAGGPLDLATPGTVKVDGAFGAGTSTMGNFNFGLVGQSVGNPTPWAVTNDSGGQNPTMIVPSIAASTGFGSVMGMPADVYGRFSYEQITQTLNSRSNSFGTFLPTLSGAPSGGFFGSFLTVESGTVSVQRTQDQYNFEGGARVQAAAGPFMLKPTGFIGFDRIDQMDNANMTGATDVFGWKQKTNIHSNYYRFGLGIGADMALPWPSLTWVNYGSASLDVVHSHFDAAQAFLCSGCALPAPANNAASGSKNGLGTHVNFFTGLKHDESPNFGEFIVAGMQYISNIPSVAYPGVAGPIGAGSGVANATGRARIASTDQIDFGVMLGLTVRFGGSAESPPVAAPPAPPAAVAPQKQVFIVFFEFDKSSLTPDGRKVVDAAAAVFKAGKSSVAIAGYTDLAGTQQYNLALSKRRADRVKTALVQDGVVASAITESWHGKENPRVPTADGVREPQNRRVEITM